MARHSGWGDPESSDKVEQPAANGADRRLGNLSCTKPAHLNFRLFLRKRGRRKGEMAQSGVEVTVEHAFGEFNCAPNLGQIHSGFTAHSRVLAALPREQERNIA